MALDDEDIRRIGRCVELSRTALNEGDQPFGSILVDVDGAILFEDHNHVAGGDTTVYTSGEHCPMCAATHAWAGLGCIVFAVSSAQLTRWQALLPPMATLPIAAVAPQLTVDGPVRQYRDEMMALYAEKFRP